MKTYIVQLENHDDVISARDKISWSKTRRVLLVWPRKGKILERRVDLLLLLRHAQHSGSQIAIVTHSGAVQANARDLGIPVFSKTEDAQGVLWRRARRLRRFRVDRQAENTQVLRQQREALKASPAPGLFPRLLAFFAGVLSFLALVLFFLPGAEVQISPVREQQRLIIPVWAGPEILAPNPSGGLPAQVLSVVVEGRDQMISTGSTHTADRAAQGEVLLTNLTDQPVAVPAGSMVVALTDPQVRFEITQSVRLPARPGAEIIAPIQAMFPGRAGNLRTGQIRAMEGPVGLRLSVENVSPTSGGSDRASPAPGEDDYQALRGRLLASLETTAREELMERVKPGQHLLAETLWNHTVLEEKGEPAVNQPGDRLQLAMQVEYQALLVEDTDLQVVAQAALDANRSPGYLPVPGSLRIEFASQPVERKQEIAAGESSPQRQLRWELLVERTQEISWSEGVLAQAIKGRRVEEAAAILQASLPLAKPPSIRISPAWWLRLPYLPFRIVMVQS